MNLDTLPGDVMQEFDAGGYVRRVRRRADLSQRELAARLDVPQSVIARVETGGSIGVELFGRILALAGLQLTVFDGVGDFVSAMPADGFRNSVGSRLPAHLDVHAAPESPTIKQLLRAADPTPRGVWYHRRTDRDTIRRAKATGPAEQLTPAVAAERRRTIRSRNARSRAAWRRD